jgi:hypothetical protein
MYRTYQCLLAAIKRQISPVTGRGVGGKSTKKIRRGGAYGPCRITDILTMIIAIPATTQQMLKNRKNLKEGGSVKTGTIMLITDMKNKTFLEMENSTNTQYSTVHTQNSVPDPGHFKTSLQR